MKNNRNRAYLLSSETECYLFKHNTPYDFFYQGGNFWIYVNEQPFLAPSTAFTFKSGLTVHEKINARSNYGGLNFRSLVPYKYHSLRKQITSQPNTLFKNKI